MNVVVLQGTLSGAPRQRTLPSGDRVANVEITVRTPGRPTETVPVAWFQPPDHLFSLAPGASVVVIGRVRRRFFKHGGATSSRTEVVAERIMLTHQRTRVLGALDVAVAALTDGQSAA